MIVCMNNMVFVIQGRLAWIGIWRQLLPTTSFSKVQVHSTRLAIASALKKKGHMWSVSFSRIPCWIIANFVQSCWPLCPFFFEFLAYLSTWLGGLKFCNSHKYVQIRLPHTNSSTFQTILDTCYYSNKLHVVVYFSIT